MRWRQAAPSKNSLRIRDEGLAGHLGVAGGPASLMSRYLDTGVFEVLLSHNRWTLADRTADAVFQQAHEAGLGVINAAPFGGGSLVRGFDAVPSYCYGPTTAETERAIRAVEAICAEAGDPARRGRAAVLDARRADPLDHCGRLAPRAHRRDHRVGGLGHPRRRVGGPVGSVGQGCRAGQLRSVTPRPLPRTPQAPARGTTPWSYPALAAAGRSDRSIPLTPNRCSESTSGKIVATVLPLARSASTWLAR